MDRLPDDPAMLVSAVNMLLRDDEYDSLESLCYSFDTTPESLKERLKGSGYVYSDDQRQFRPEGFNQGTQVR